MKKLLGFSLALGLMLSAFNASASPGLHVTGQTKLQSVKQIYVGDMGRSDEARRFRLLLQEQLSQKGFVVADKPEDADAILSGRVVGEG